MMKLVPYKLHLLCIKLDKISDRFDIISVEVVFHDIINDLSLSMIQKIFKSAILFDKLGNEFFKKNMKGIN